VIDPELQRTDDTLVNGRSKHWRNTGHFYLGLTGQQLILPGEETILERLADQL